MQIRAYIKQSTSVPKNTKTFCLLWTISSSPRLTLGGARLLAFTPPPNSHATRDEVHLRQQESPVTALPVHMHDIYAHETYTFIHPHTYIVPHMSSGPCKRTPCTHKHS